MPDQQTFVLDPASTDHHAEDRALRARGPATQVDILGVTAWSVSDPRLLKEILTSPHVSKDARAHWPAFEETVATWPLALWIAVNNMFTAYGADHRRLRRMVAPAFAARRIQAMRPGVEAVVTGLLDDLAALSADDAVDLREHLAYPLPIAVIGQLMGVPEHERPGFRAMVDRVFATTLTAEEAAANTSALYAALDELVAAKRARPGDDMTSLLVAARDDEGDGGGFTDAELRDTLLLMISAGYETTVNVIDQAVTALLTDPRSSPVCGPDASTGAMSWRRPSGTSRRSNTFPSVTPSPTSPCPTAGRSPRATRSSSRSPPPTGTPPGTARPPTASTPPVRRRTTSPSVTASTSVSALPSPAWRSRPLCGCSSNGSRTPDSPSPPTGCGPCPP